MADKEKQDVDRAGDSDFKLLKDDYVAGVGESELDNRPSTLPPPASGGVPSNEAGWVSRFEEVDPTPIDVPAKKLAWGSRRDFLLYGAGVAATGAALWWLLPSDPDAPSDPTNIKNRVVAPAVRKELDSLTTRLGLSHTRQENALNRVLTFDDDVAEALYSPTREVPTYPKSQAIRDLRNNYDGATPDDSYLADWELKLSGLASGKEVNLTIADLLKNFAHHEQVTRLCCVEGWSAIAWWGGLRFGDLIAAYPPAPGMRWAAMRSEVNLDSDGNSDPYYVSIDLPTAMHPQALLATHLNGQPLDLDHGAPMRLVVPMKLGLKNIKAVTSIEYVAKEPADYWNERGYSKYDGL